MTVDPDIAPFYEVTFILCSVVVCAHCGCDPVYESSHPQFTDENYYDQAVAMHAAGWTVNGLDAACPSCTAKQRSATNLD